MSNEDESSSASSSEEDDGSLNSSVLGTKDYWDSAYKKELENFAEIGDEGTVWFGEDAIKRVVKWLNKTDLDKEKSLVLDLGSGNGSMLLSLATSGWRRLTGVDYSKGAVKLAASIARRKVEDGWLKGFHVFELTGEEQQQQQQQQQETDKASKEKISVQRLNAAAPSQNPSLCPYLAFALYDLTITPSSSSSLSETNSSVDETSPLFPPHPKFDVILDKGTFDAISLCPEEADRKKQLYIEFVRTVLREEEEEEEEERVDSQGGIFCLTSCNWTEDELVKIFGQHFTLRDRIEFPSFQFGGKTGSTVTSLVFEKNKRSSFQF